MIHGNDSMAQDHATEPLRSITKEELAWHKAPETCWIAVDGIVYDMHDFGR